MVDVCVCHWKVVCVGLEEERDSLCTLLLSEKDEWSSMNNKIEWKAMTSPKDRDELVRVKWGFSQDVSWVSSGFIRDEFY